MRTLFLAALLLAASAGSLRCDDTVMSGDMKQSFNRQLRGAFTLVTQLLAFRIHFHRYPADTNEFLKFATPHKEFNLLRFPDLVLTPDTDGGITYAYNDPDTHQKHTGRLGPDTSGNTNSNPK